jgi:hypothetical protein
MDKLIGALLGTLIAIPILYFFDIYGAIFLILVWLIYVETN